MEDEEIIQLYFKRKEDAIVETDKKYSAYLRHISNSILRCKEDVNECINDTYLKVWNTIPPNRPSVFKLFVAKITRNISINMYKKVKAKKRNKNMEVALKELEESIPNNDNLERVVEYNELVKYLNEFVAKLPIDKRGIFLSRYWYLSKVKDIASDYNMPENNVKVMLCRMRKDLKDYLIERGVSL